MIIVDPAELSLPWAVVIGGGAILGVVLLGRAASKKAQGDGKAVPVKPRLIHSLGTSVPIIGDVLEVLKNAGVRHDWMTAQSRRFNFEPWQINIPGTPAMVVLANPAGLEAVTTSQFDNFVKGPTHRYVLQDVLGGGIVNSDGEHWYHQRKTAAKFFSAKTLRLMMMRTMKRNMKKVYNVLDSQSGKGNLVDLSLLFHQFTLQTFMEVGVGVDFPIIGNAEALPFEIALEDSLPIVTRRRLLPPFIWKLERWFNIGREKRLKEAMATIHSQLNELITKSLNRQSDAEAESDESGERVRSAIELFVEHNQADQVGFEPRDLVDFVVNFVIAARDTSSVATAWFFYALSKHPLVEAKIREELAAKLPSLGVDVDGYVTADHVKQLVYLEAAIKESLRYYPSGPLLIRQSLKDTVIDENLFIRRGQVVAVSVYAMARNPTVWGPDAAEFKPERWIDPTSGELLSVPSTKFATFSSGPRICVGMNLAMINLRVMIANLLHRYKFELDPSNDGSYLNSITLLMKNPLLAKVDRT